MLTGVEGAAACKNDIIVVDRSKEELSERIDKVLTRIQDIGFQLRHEMCHFYLQEIQYLGLIFDRHDRRPDPANVAAI